MLGLFMQTGASTFQPCPSISGLVEAQSVAVGARQAPRGQCPALLWWPQLLVKEKPQLHQF